jgi:hypothetical protein
MSEIIYSQQYANVVGRVNSLTHFHENDTICRLMALSLRFACEY